MILKNIFYLFALAVFLMWAPSMPADTVVHVTPDGKKETLEGDIQSESWEKVVIKTSEGKTVTVMSNTILSVTRSLPSSLTKAESLSATAETPEEVKKAEALFQKLKTRSTSPLWEREQAAVFQFHMLAQRGQLQKAIQAAQEIAKINPQSRHLHIIWKNSAQLALNAKKPVILKNAIQNLRPLGGFGRNQANFFEGEKLLIEGDIKGAERKFRTVFKQMEADQSLWGRRLWMDAATRYAQTLIKQEKVEQAKEQLEIIEKKLDTLNDRGHGLYHTLQGDILRLESKAAEALYAYMRVIVQFPNDLDLKAHCLTQGAQLSQELGYSDTAKKLKNELNKIQGKN